MAITNDDVKLFSGKKSPLKHFCVSHEQGETNNRAFFRQAESAAKTMGLLNQQDLVRLNNAIVLAKQNMASLGGSYPLFLIVQMVLP